MSAIELIILAAGLAMDAFAVSICKGLSVRKYRKGQSVTAGLYFGGFQAVMPVIGWLLGRQFESLIKSVDHWIAFGLLACIGIEMSADAFKKEEDKTIDPYGLKSQLLLAVATSIDALAIGISFACTGYNELSQLWTPLALIGAASFVMSLIGFALGVRFGDEVTRKVKPEILGGLILIGIGIKILIEHTLR